MMLAGGACVHQGYERHSPPNIFSLKRYWVGMRLAGGACVSDLNNILQRLGTRCFRPKVPAGFLFKINIV